MVSAESLLRPGRREPFAAAMLLAMLCSPVSATSPAEVNLAVIAGSWPDQFDMRGTKTEPTWVESVRLVRRGDLFALEGGGLHDGEQAIEAVEVDAAGAVRRVACPAAMDCARRDALAGFLASAEFVAAHRAGRLRGRARIQSYGQRAIFCVPGEALGIDSPLLDPCFDVSTGAVLAQRDRASGGFGGPSLDPVSVRYVDPPGSLPLLLRSH